MNELHYSRERAQFIVKQFDKNGDGKMSVKEMERFKNSVKQTSVTTAQDRWIVVANICVIEANKSPVLVMSCTFIVTNYYLAYYYANYFKTNAFGET